jgi:hypothetical protein
MRLSSVVAILAVVFGTGILKAQGVAPAVRPEDPDTRALVARGIERSETFRELNARLDKGDVVVYVRYSPCMGGVPACLLWAGQGINSRRLLIKLDRFGRSPDELTALLAHELQHATEVLAAASIVDRLTFQESFASLGWTHAAGFETEAAANVARTVATQLAERGNVRSAAAPRR